MKQRPSKRYVVERLREYLQTTQIPTKRIWIERGVGGTPSLHFAKEIDYTVLWDLRKLVNLLGYQLTDGPSGTYFVEEDPFSCIY